MSDMKATLAKGDDGSLTVKGFEELNYNFHYTSPVFDVNHKKLAEIYEKWGRVLIVIDTSESAMLASLISSRPPDLPEAD